MKRAAIERITADSKSIAAIQKQLPQWILSFSSVLADMGTHSTYLLVLPMPFFFDKKEFSAEESSLTIAASAVFLLSAGVYISSFLKDLAKLPRPFSPPCTRINRHQSTGNEFGFPSTHSANAASIAMFLYFYSDVLGFLLDSLLFQFDGWIFGSALFSLQFHSPSSTLIKFIAVFYGVFMGISRVLTGMHSWLDVWGGWSIGVFIFLCWKVVKDWIFSRIKSGGFEVVFSALFFLYFLLAIHPNAKECPCYKDSIAFISVSTGVVIGLWLRKINFENVENCRVNFIVKIAIGIVCIYFFRMVARKVIKSLVVLYLGIAILAVFIVPKTICFLHA